MSTAETVAVGREQLQQFMVPVVLLDSARQTLAEGWLTLDRPTVGRVALVSFSDGAGRMSSVPMWVAAA